jgi:hypothetical protein
VVERSAVNRLVVGSSPTWGVKIVIVLFIGKAQSELNIKIYFITRQKTKNML